MTQVPLAQVRNLLLDMDGTLYLGSHLLPGAAELLAHLRESGRAFLCFTNNPSADAAHYAEKLTRLGVPVETGEVFTAGEATARYLAQQTRYRRVYAVGTPSFEAELERAGLTLTDHNPDAVVLAFDTTLTYRKLERATHLIRRGLPYIATNPDKVCPTPEGPIPDCGAMAALLHAATDRTPKFIGKPHAEMARMGLARLGAEPASTAMVGDRLYTDMQMAYDAGLTAILVLSGETTRDDLRAAARQPDYVFTDAQALCEALREAGPLEKHS